MEAGGAAPQSPRPPALQTRVHVSGFPPYTQSADLARTFAQFGALRVERLHARQMFAVLAYTAPEHAQAAVQASKKVNIYGEFLTVRPFTQRDNVPAQPKRNFTRSKQKDMIVEPKDIELSGDFHQQMEQILARVRLTQEEATALGELYADTERVLQAIWPGCVAMPFGSVTTGLGIKTSDADCFVRVPPLFLQQHQSQHQQLQPALVQRARRVLHAHPDTFAEIVAIPRASTPIVKFFHLPTATNCDLSFKTPLGERNSKLVAFLLHSDPRLLPAAVLLKYWAKVHQLSGTGRLTNYALTMMIIFYLQQPEVGLLPSVHWLQRDPQHDVIVDHWNTGFSPRREDLPPVTNTCSVAELLGGFFQFYSKFDFESLVVCPYLGRAVKKTCFLDVSRLPPEMARYKANTVSLLAPPLRALTALCVQDPLEQSHNVASALSPRLAADLKAYLQFASKAYEHDDTETRSRFLPTILLQKPKIVRQKLHPEFKINLYPKTIAAIPAQNRRQLLREAALTVFGKILKIHLGKLEERVNPDTDREKEKYAGTITKAVWKRKQFSRLYDVFDMDFVNKEAHITQEILNVEKTTFKANFQLTLTYIPAQKMAMVSIKLSNGDIEEFKEFGKFFVTVTQNWFTRLLRAPVATDTTAHNNNHLDSDDESAGDHNDNDDPPSDDDDDSDLQDGDNDVRLENDTTENDVTTRNDVVTKNDDNDRTKNSNETDDNDKTVKIIDAERKDSGKTREKDKIACGNKSKISVSNKTKKVGVSKDTSNVPSAEVQRGNSLTTDTQTNS